MTQEERSEKSKQLILDAALKLFSHKGYGATSVNDIADEAGLSKGNVYHHFPDKDAIFRELLDEYIELVDSARFPFMRVLEGPDTFPDNIEELGFAARDSVRQFRSYLALIYVDVIEFGGTHIRKFYGGMSERFARFFDDHGLRERIQSRLRPEVSPVDAMLLTSRLFFNYFSLEILFGVDEPFGKDTHEVVKEIADIIRNGVCAR